MKNILKISVMLFVILFLSSVLHAEEITFSYGKNINWLSASKNAGLESQMFELEIRKPWTSWLDVGIVGTIIQSKLSYAHVIDGVYFSGTDDTAIISGRVSINKVFGIVVTRAYVGVGLNMDNHYPEFGDSGVISNIGGSVGIKVYGCLVRYGLVHFSDPLQHHDKGHNFQYISLGIAF